jgi:signal transduction histidine kinase
MTETAANTFRTFGRLGFHEKMVASLLGLERFLAQIRSASGREEIMALTLGHIRTLIPVELAAFYCPQGADAQFQLQTPLEPEEAAHLTGLVDEAIDSGIFGWALNHRRPAAIKAAGGTITLVLGALRTRQRVLGMFAGVLSPISASGWDANTIVLATHLDCAADAILSEDLSAELQTQNRNLDALVEQRTHQLVQAKEAAETANRAKSTFLAMISHELRTPLNAILGHTQILIGNPTLAPDHQKQIQIVQQSAEELLSLINKLLEASSTNSAAIDLETRETPLDPLLDETAALVRRRAEAKGLYFQCTRSPGLPHCLTMDPKRLKQVLLNLLDNAIQFTTEGSVMFDVSRQHDRLRFAVLDTGQGLAHESLPDLFYSSQRLGKDPGEEVGNGLGLSVSKRILDAMDVELCMRSKIGLGTAFWFDLACDPGEEHPDILQRRPHPMPEQVEHAFGSNHLPPQTLPKLQELAASGDVLELQKAFEEILANSTPPNPLVAKLLDLTRSCKIKTVREILGDYESDHPGY